MLAVSDEDEEKVSTYIEKMGVAVRTSAGFKGNEAWGVRAYPSAVLINPKGEIVWTGDPRDTINSQIKSALKGAKPAGGGYLGFDAGRELSPKLKSAAKAAAEGKLGKAHGAALKLANDEKADAATREDAEVFAGEILAYAELLQVQAERFIEDRSMIKGVEVLEAVAAAMKGTEFATGVEGRLAEIGKDPELQKELAAAQAFAKAMAAAEKRGMKKSASKFEAVVKKYPGTKAAKRATMKLRNI